jgi:FkbM family methyltransferase
MEMARRTNLIVRRYPPTNALDQELRRIIATYDISTIIDVGAHVGGFALRRREQGFDGRLISIEPFEASYVALAAMAANDDHWEAIQVALGGSDGTKRMHQYTGDGQFNSLRDLDDHATEYKSDLRSIASVEVGMCRLDAIWPSIGADARSSLLKIDTQGYDLEVIAGAGDLISSFPAVLAEVAIKPLYEGAPLFEELVAAMRERGFEITGTFPLHRYADGVRVIEFDCTFINVQRGPAENP